MKKLLIGVLTMAMLGGAIGAAVAADDSKVKAATDQVQTGTKEIGDGKVGTGTADTAKGIGNTVVEGSKYAGEKVKESAQAAEPQAKSAWTNLKETADAFGTSVKTFFTRLFSN
jgi:hypothetical protein